MQHHVYVASDDVVGHWGTRKIRASDVALVHCLTSTEASTARRSLPTAQPPPAERTVPLTAQGLAHLRANPEDAVLLYRVATDFREFTRLWRFRAQETGDVRMLGDGLWPAQETMVRVLSEHPHVYCLKARKLGQSTVATAYMAYVLRFRDQNARVHLHSRAERAALELHASVKFGMGGLPEWARLPVTRSTQRETEWDAGPEDRRLVAAYATTDATAVEATCSAALLDEWSDMPRPDVVYASLEPTFAHGTSLILTTGAGPANPTADYWRRCEAGDGLHFPLFIDALQRPDRDDEWLALKKRQMLASQFKNEYAMSPEDAIAGTQGYVFASEDVDAAGTDFRPPSPAVRGRKYIKAWDIGVKDASVGTCLDLTERDGIIDVAEQRRFVGLSYPQIVAEIERMHRDYPGPTVVEANAMGLAVIQHLSIPEHQVVPFTTTALSKARAIENLAIYLQNWQLKYDPHAFPQLDHELRAYQIPDEYCVQDCVMSIAIALDQAPTAFTGGRVLQVIQL